MTAAGEGPEDREDRGVLSGLSQEAGHFNRRVTEYSIFPGVASIKTKPGRGQEQWK